MIKIRSFQVIENSCKTKTITQRNQSRQRFVTQLMLCLALGGKKDSYRIMQWPFPNPLFPEYSQKMRGQEKQTTLRNSRFIMFWHNWKQSGKGSVQYLNRCDPIFSFRQKKSFQRKTGNSTNTSGQNHIICQALMNHIQHVSLYSFYWCPG